MPSTNYCIKKSFDFVVKTPPAVQLYGSCKAKIGSGEPNRKKSS
jgi:ribosomal protein L11